MCVEVNERHSSDSTGAPGNRPRSHVMSGRPAGRSGISLSANNLCRPADACCLQVSGPCRAEQPTAVFAWARGGHGVDARAGAL
jgi:hypothetical protein